MLDDNATVYTPNFKLTKSRDTRGDRRVGGRKNGRRSNGSDRDRGYRQGKNNNNRSIEASQHNTAVPSPNNMHKQ